MGSQHKYVKNTTLEIKNEFLHEMVSMRIFEKLENFWKFYAEEYTFTTSVARAIF